LNFLKPSQAKACGYSSFLKGGEILSPLETKIDTLLFRLYDLTEEEIKIVEGGNL
jgi:hypothetical protein